MIYRILFYVITKMINKEQVDDEEENSYEVVMQEK